MSTASINRPRESSARPDSGRRHAVVVGAGLGGLSAAIHLRKAGFEVTVLEGNAQVGGRANRISRDGFHFDTGPTLLNYPWVFRDLFAAAGCVMADHVELLQVDPSVSFQWRDGSRLSLSSDYPTLLREFSRFEQHAGPALTAWLADGAEKFRVAFDKLVTRNAKGVWDWFKPLKLRELLATGAWRSLDGELKRFFKSRHIREALGSYAMYLGGSPFKLPGMFSILPWGELAHGLWLPKGGIYAMVTAIADAARRMGVAIRTRARVDEIMMEGGRARGVLLAGGEQLKADIVVSNVDVPTTNSKLLGDNVLRAEGTATARDTRMTPGVLTFYWGVRGQVPKLGHHTIFLPPDYRGSFADLMDRGRIPHDPPFYVAQPSATDPSLAPAGDTSVFVLVPTPTTDRLANMDWDATAAELKRKVLARLASHGVDLHPERIVVEETWSPVEWGRRFGLHNGSAFGASHNLMQLGPWRAPNRSRDVAGLYYVGASTTPGTGMPMVVLGGKMTAERILEDVQAHVG